MNINQRASASVLSVYAVCLYEFIDVKFTKTCSQAYTLLW